LDLAPPQVAKRKSGKERSAKQAKIAVNIPLEPSLAKDTFLLLEERQLDQSAITSYDLAAGTAVSTIGYEDTSTSTDLLDLRNFDFIVHGVRSSSTVVLLSVHCTALPVHHACAQN
jgi:hypothetical protein